MNKHILIEEDIEKAIQHSMDYESKNHGNNCFFNVIENSDSKEFLEFCEKYSEFTYIDAIGGSKQPEGSRRYRTPLSFEDVIVKVTDKNLGAGIKTYHRPLHKFHEHHEWEGGYIEGFIRGFDYNSEYDDIIIWQYIKMEHLGTILKAFPNKIEYYD